jgi:hypothetical protein
MSDDDSSLCSCSKIIDSGEACLQGWIDGAMSSVGVENPTVTTLLLIYPKWAFVSSTKLIVAAFFWSLGFMSVNGEECWGRDTSFAKTPRDGSCTMDALVLSGFFAAVSLCAAIPLCEYISSMPLPYKSHQNTLMLLLLTVWVSDGAWSYFNWFAFSLAVGVDVSKDADVYYALDDYFVGGVLAFLLNGLFFYLTHNTCRWGMIKAYRLVQVRAATHLLSDKQNGGGGPSESPTRSDNNDFEVTLWRCDVYFAALVACAYYGFGPIGTMFLELSNANSPFAIAILNAVGTGMGVLLGQVCVYLLPLTMWMIAHDEHGNDDHNVAVAGSGKSKHRAAAAGGADVYATNTTEGVRVSVTSHTMPKWKQAHHQQQRQRQKGGAAEVAADVVGCVGEYTVSEIHKL